MEHLLPPDILDDFSPEDIIDMSRHVDDCRCECRSHFTVKDGLIHVHGRPVFDRLMVRGSLSLQGNEEIRRLPDLLVATDSIYLFDCPNLEVTPSRMYAGDTIRLDETNIRELPGTITAGRAIRIEDCPNLQAIPAGLQTPGLHAAGCTKLTSIAGGLTFMMLDLSGSPIEELPADLKVTTELKLHGCKRLSRIPEGVVVSGAIDLRGCDMLFTLPRSVQPSIAVTDGLMLAQDWVIVPKMAPEEASMCLGVKALEAFPHCHFKNLVRMQDPVTFVEQGRPFSTHAVGTLKSPRYHKPERQHLQRLMWRFNGEPTVRRPLALGSRAGGDDAERSTE